MMYLIRETRHYYAGTIHNGAVRYYGKVAYDDTAPLVPFDSHADATAAIAAIEDESFRILAHGEYAAPTLVAVPVDRANAEARERVTAGIEWDKQTNG